jgi:AraC-like DNA-binding protein
MSGKTLNAYLPLLKSKQQEYIVHCVQTFGDMPDFHRGMLPFLSAQTAANCLRVKLERVKGEMQPLIGEQITPVIGEKFIRGIISIFEGALVHKLSEDELSATIHLKDGKLAREYYKRYSDSFCVSVAKWDAKGMALLEKVGQNLWKVTASKRLHHQAIEWLSDNYS